jgi:serine/threonine protein kinase/tetratricopeptide (TPR) repeat protein
MIGQTVGHYKILDRLGAGGMGEVYRAEDSVLKRQVALKVLPPEVAGSQERLKRFRREAELVASLNHPNIVVIYSVEEAESIRFLTMELIEGQPLNRVIPADGLPVEEYFDIAVPLADALSVAHEQGIVHRDLKPDNIMVSDRGVVKVLDFGLAKPSSPAEDFDSTNLPTETLTSEGKIQGTVPYMSPEQVRGLELDHQSDIFSLGIVLHEMATGRRLFHGESSADTVTAILTKEPDSVAEVRPELPFHLSRIISHCLVKNQAHRYQSTGDLRDELVGLKREVESGRIRTGSLSKTDIDSKDGQVRWGRWILAGLLLVAVVTGLILLLPPPVETARAALAVMPFENLTGDPNRSYVGEGLSAGMITQLSEVRGLTVVGRSEAWSLRNEGLTSRQVGKRLGVEMVVEGGLLPSEGIRADITLTDARTGLVLWSESFVGDRSEIFEVEKQITQSLTQFLSIPLSRAERARLAKNPTASLQAYDFYLQGQQYLEDVHNSEGPEFARDLYRQAVRIDPEFALAHVGMSNALWRIYQQGRESEYLAEAENEARKALDIDPELPDAQVALGQVYRSTGRYAESIGQLRQILADHPNPAEAYRQLAFSFAAAGDYEGAEESLRYSLSLRREDWKRWNYLGAFYVLRGDYAEARKYFIKAEELAPEDITWPRENLASVQILEGDFDGAIDAFEQIEGPSDDPNLMSNIGTAYFFADRLDDAERYYELAVELRPRSPVYHGNLADLYLRQGRSDEAQESYRSALRLITESLESDPRDLEVRVNQALYSAKVGDCDAAILIADTIRSDVSFSATFVHNRALAYALCGEKKKTLTAIREAVELGFSPELIRQEDEFQNFINDPHFLEVLGSSP